MNKKFLRAFDLNIKGKFSYLPKYNEAMSIRHLGDVVLIDSGLNSNMFNIIYGNENIDRASVKAAIDYFRSKKLPYAFWIGFESDPSWLEDELAALGLITVETEWAMFCDLEKQDSGDTHSDLDIRQVRDFAGVQDIISVINNILPINEHLAIKSFYELSAPALLFKGCSLTFFVGYAGEKPVTLSSLFCKEGIASIFDVIVVPEMRGKGLGKTMTLKAMWQAQEKNFTKCVLTATNDAQYLYQKLGFEAFKTMKVYQDP